MIDNAKFEETVNSHTKTLQIIVAALTSGVVIFGTVALFMNPEKSDDWLIPSIFGGIGILVMIKSFIVPSLIAGSAVSQCLSQTSHPKNDGKDNEQKISLVRIFQLKTIVGCALVEGAGFLNIIAYILAGNYINLGVMILTVGLLATRIPSANGVKQWVNDQIQLHH